MGTLRTIAFLFLLCCAVVEQNNAVPIPPTTAAPALPLETEFYTETYTEVVNETVLSSDIEGTIQQRQERPLTGPVAKPSTDTRRDDHQQSFNTEASDGQDQNDALGGNADNLASSDTDTISDGTDLISSEHKSTDADAIVNGENDSHSAPHDGVNTTAASTRSTPLVVSAMHLNASFISVRTGSAKETLSNTPQDSASREDERSHHESNQDEVSATAEHSTTSSTPHHLTPSTSGILHHRTESIRRTHHEESVKSEITPSLEPYVTEIYTEFVERTELVMSDIDSKSEETISAQDEEDVEHRDTISKAEDEIDEEPASSTPIVVSSISQNTDQIKHSTISTLPHSSAEPLFADRMAMTPYDTLLSPNTIAFAVVDTNFTPDNGDITPTPSDLSSSAPDLTPNKEMLTASVSVSSATHHATASPSDSSAGESIAWFPEPVATEIYTEIMEITELVMSDTESESVEGSEQSSVIGNTEHETNQTPQLTMPITHTTGSVPVSTSLMSDTSSVRPHGSTLGMVMTHYTKLGTEEITASLTSSRSTPDSLNITLEQSDIALEPSDSTPEQSDIAPEPSDSTPEQSDITPEQSDITQEQSDIEPEQSDITPEQYDIMPEQSDIEPEQSDITPEQYDSTPEQYDSIPEQYSIPKELALYVPDTVTSSSELFVTETYTEIMEITELSMSDTASDTKSEETILTPESEDSVQKNVNTHEGGDDDYTPSSDKHQSFLAPNAIVSTLATPASVQESTIESFNKSSIGPHGTKVHGTLNITMSNTREISTALVDTISTLEISDYTLDSSDSTPDSPDYTLDSLDSTPDSPDYTLDSLDSTPDSPDSTQDSSDSTLHSSNLKPESSDFTPDSFDSTLNSSDSTPDSPDYTLDSLDSTLDSSDSTQDFPDSTPDSPDYTLDRLDSTLDSPDYTLDNLDSTLDSSDYTLNNPDYTLDSAYSTPDSPDSTLHSSNLKPESSDFTPDSFDSTLDSSDSAPDSHDSTLNNPDNTLDSSYSTPDSPDTTPDNPDTTLNNSDSTPKATIDPSTTAESTLDEPSNTRYPASTTKGTPNGDSVTPSQEPFVTELYTEIMEITELLMSEEKD